MKKMRKERQCEFICVKSPFEAIIFNKYDYAFTWICFEDSLCLFMVDCIDRLNARDGIDVKETAAEG
jgi:hypothetical protein